ncbi:hypothetical protein HYQ45_016339 [Verticillium longisporum]|uniref:AB hydrolase-1 domain-containing protein n=2 Tax=Verticillium longisporum TaxID=100787 RepID=A0A8I3AJA2_VERLO|nr:hypothetical protein HYQ45_016339 [Verticillium longisporum]KAG7118375.1 hypothetical protein HYQ44_005518 [Verticillium longisporum]KAG7149002.1 hypothetical protein HYQ46_002089 [Verticillium longisporum]
MNNKGDVIALGEGARDALFNDCDTETADQLVAGAVYQSTASFETPTTFAAADVAVSKTYVVCEDDHALPLDAQLAMITALGNVTVIRVHSGHCVQLNKELVPKSLDVIEAAAGYEGLAKA